jgi:hypothetical protein
LIECICFLELKKNKYINSFTLSSLNRNTETKKKVTKKGIIITALIVIGIVAASFIVYLVP